MVQIMENLRASLTSKVGSLSPVWIGGLAGGAVPKSGLVGRVGLSAPVRVDRVEARSSNLSIPVAKMRKNSRHTNCFFTGEFLTHRLEYSLSSYFYR